MTIKELKEKIKSYPYNEFAIDKMKAECLHKIDSIDFADELPF